MLTVLLGQLDSSLGVGRSAFTATSGKTQHDPFHLGLDRLPLRGAVRAGATHRFLVRIFLAPPLFGLGRVFFRLETIKPFFDPHFGLSFQSAQCAIDRGYQRLGLPETPHQAFPVLAQDRARIEIGRFENRPDLFEREPELAMKPNVLQAGDIRFCIQAIPGRTPP